MSKGSLFALFALGRQSVGSDGDAGISPRITPLWQRRAVLLVATLAVALCLGVGVGPQTQVAHAAGTCTAKLKATSPKYNLPFLQGYLIAYVYGYYYSDGSFCGSFATGQVHLNGGAQPGG